MTDRIRMNTADGLARLLQTLDLLDVEVPAEVLALAERKVAFQAAGREVAARLEALEVELREAGKAQPFLDSEALVAKGVKSVFDTALPEDVVARLEAEQDDARRRGLAAKAGAEGVTAGVERFIVSAEFKKILAEQFAAVVGYTPGEDESWRKVADAAARKETMKPILSSYALEIARAEGATPEERRELRKMIDESTGHLPSLAEVRRTVRDRAQTSGRQATAENAQKAARLNKLLDHKAGVLDRAFTQYGETYEEVPEVQEKVEKIDQEITDLRAALGV